MNEPISFKRAIGRTSFVILLLYILAVPQLRSNNPGPGFDTIANWIESISFLGRVGIGLGFLFVIAFATTLSRLRYQNQAQADQSGRAPAEVLPISEAVKLTSGGSGLASAPFRPFLAFFDLIGWIQVQEPDKECVVIDTRYVVRKTRIYAAPLRLIGKPISARRVLLSPAPLDDVSSTALTSDQLELTLVVSAKYQVADPTYVASLEAPLSELKNLLTGIIAEYIRSASLEEIVRDDGTLRADLKRRMEASTTIQSKFILKEVLKALPTGDERIIEIIRQTRAEIQRRGLVEQEGLNLEIQASYEQRIAQAQKELEDEFAQRQHLRELDMIRLVGELDLQREFVRSIAAIAASGINPSEAIREIRSMILKGGQQEVVKATALPKSDGAKDSLIDLERNSLKQVQAALGIRQFNLVEIGNSSGKPASATISFDDFDVLINCPSDYPGKAPTVRLKLEDNQEMPAVVPWRKGNNLADAVTAAVMQARFTVEDETE